MKTIIVILASIFILSACEKQEGPLEAKKITSETAIYKVTIYNNTLKYRAQSHSSSSNFIKGGVVIDSVNFTCMHYFGDSLCFEKTIFGGKLYYNLGYQHSIVFFTNEKRFRIEVWVPGDPTYTHKRSNYISSDIKEFVITDDTSFN